LGLAPFPFYDAGELTKSNTLRLQSERPEPCLLRQAESLAAWRKECAERDRIHAIQRAADERELAALKENTRLSDDELTKLYQLMS
jgi:hypothetical protein